MSHGDDKSKQFVAEPLKENQKSVLVMCLQQILRILWWRDRHTKPKNKNFLLGTFMQIITHFYFQFLLFGTRNVIRRHLTPIYTHLFIEKWLQENPGPTGSNQLIITWPAISGKVNNFPRYANSGRTLCRSPFVDILSQCWENRLTNLSVKKTEPLK